MSEFKQYIRVNVAEMRTYVPFENMENISVSDADRKGTFEGGFIARDPKNHKDQWFVSAKYFAENFSEQPAEIQEGTPEGTPKTYHNSEASGARKNVSFGQALETVKLGGFMRLPSWSADVKIKAQFPDKNSKMTAPYLYVESRFGMVPWKETMIELFSNDWEIGK